MPVRKRSSSTTPSAALLRRVAEAADGHRTGRKVWFAAKDDSRSDVRGPFRTVAAARAATRGMRRGWQVVGPIQTPPDNAPQGLVALRATIRDKRGREHIYDIDLAATDMLVWSLAAFDRFMAPHYLRELGTDGVQQMRADVANGKRALPLLHGANTPSLSAPFGATYLVSAKKRARGAT